MTLYEWVEGLFAEANKSRTNFFIDFQAKLAKGIAMGFVQVLGETGLMEVLATLRGGMAQGNPIVANMENKAWLKNPLKIHDPPTLIAALRRGIVPDNLFVTEMGMNGYDTAHIEQLKKVTMFYPSAQDFITFAVRDTFAPDVVSRYGYDENYPTAIDEQVEKAGMNPEWMKHFWRAHWQLPSPTQMYEMLHRDIITKQDAETLLRTNDYAPYFIKPMLDISYNTFTRVDVHRMYNEGVLTKQEVMRAYKDLGYDDVKAGKLTEWATKESLSRERDLTMSQTLEVYMEGEISKTDAVAALMKLGYDDKESALVLKLEDDKIERAYRKREKAVLVKQYIKGIILLPVFEAELGKLKITEREKKLTLKEAALQVKEIKAPL